MLWLCYVQVEEGEEVPEVLKGIVKTKSVDTSSTTNVEPSENLWVTHRSTANRNKLVTVQKPNYYYGNTTVDLVIRALLGL